MKKLIWGNESDTMADYPDFVETCGYGDVRGIGGANCRHSFHPFLEGISEPAYTPEELEGMKSKNRPKVEFDGRVYDAYQATQEQRRIEREIRKQTRRKMAFESSGCDEKRAAAASAKLRTLNAKYKTFSKKAGLPEQRDRMEVLYP